MRLLPLFFLLCLWSGAIFGAPISIKEIGFLVRQQTPENEILADVIQRRIARRPTEADFRLLKENGASESLLQKLRSPTLYLSEVEQKKEAKRIESNRAEAQKRAGEEAAAQVAQQKHTQTFVLAGGASDLVKQMLDGKLVRLEEGTVKPSEVHDLAEIKVFAFYYSAKWCAPCRAFTPKLVEAYRELKATYPEFEIIFVSADHDEFNMKDYMRSHKMPWPAVKFSEIDSSMQQWTGKSIPSLVAVNNFGKALTTNGVDKRYLPPDEVLEGVRYILKKMAPQR